MKQKFSTSWLSSKQVRKQRKYRHNAPLHRKHSFLSAPLSKELRKQHGKRSVPVKKGDEVLIMRGTFAKKQGKILLVDTTRSRVSVENITRSKKDGTKVTVWFNPSNLQITTLSLQDNKRLKRIRKDNTDTKPKQQETQSTNKKEQTNNASNKNSN